MSQSDRGELSQDVVFDLLSNPRRRFVLSYLRQEGGPVDLVDLADEIAAWENDTPVEDLTSQQRKRVYVSIYQTHVPKLEDAGVVDYDRESGLVQLASRAEEIDDYLQGEEERVPWQLYYLGLAVVSAVFYFLVSFDVSVFAAIDAFTAGLIIIVAFAALAVAHFLYTRYADRRMPPELVNSRERSRP